MFSDDFDDSANVRQPSPDLNPYVDESESNVTRLIRAWTDERNSPDLLIFRGELLDDLLQKLHQQAIMVEHLSVDPNTTEEEHLRLTLVQMDMERVKFIVKSYARVRLYKIEKYAPFIMGRPEMQGRLSHIELTYAKRGGTVDLEKDSVHILRYRTIEQILSRRQVELV
ncbi:GINS complex subunit [Tulasnella sp. 418]|nr:GINS complex subunit [Tulasnella sp. 418]